MILDEIGRGTSTFDGLAIAWAVSEHLHTAVGCRAMFATHYHPLTELAKGLKGVANYSVSAREHEGDVVFLHRIAQGPASRSYGIAVARLAGLPQPVLERAGAILNGLENDTPVPGGPSGKAMPAQLDLFGVAPAEPMKQPEPAVDEAVIAVAEQIRGLDIDGMTPLAALQKLAEWKNKLG